MGTIIFVIVMILIIVSAVRKSTAQTDRRQQRPPEEARQQNAHARRREAEAKKQADKARAAQAQKQAAKAQADKSQAARKHMTEKWMEEDSLRKEGRPEHVWKAAGVEEGDGVILASAKLTSYAAEKDNEENSQEDLLGPVYDLMVKGPDTSIAFERDFLAEGMDMLNRYQ